MRRSLEQPLLLYLGESHARVLKRDTIYGLIASLCDKKEFLDYIHVIYKYIEDDLRIEDEKEQSEYITKNIKVSYCANPNFAIIHDKEKLISFMELNEPTVLKGGSNGF